MKYTKKDIKVIKQEIKKLMKAGVKVKKIAKHFKICKSTVYNYLGK